MIGPWKKRQLTILSSAMLLSIAWLATVTFPGRTLGGYMGFEFYWKDRRGRRHTTLIPARWARGSVINVYVNPDPENKGRDRLLKEGAERWVKRMAKRGITIRVRIGYPPAGAKNVVEYQWHDDQEQNGKFRLGKGPGRLSAYTLPQRGPIIQRKPYVLGIRGAVVKVWGGLVLRKDVKSDAEGIRNVGEHEMSHALGFRDEPQGSVMRHQQGYKKRGLNLIDKRELNEVYGRAVSEGGTWPRGVVTLVAHDAASSLFTYRIVFDQAETPIAEEHVSMILFTLAPDLVESITRPDGWVSLVADGPVSIDDPFFAEFYRDFYPVPSPLLSGAPLSLVGLQASPAQAARDGLDPSVDPALSLERPELIVRIRARRPYVVGPVAVWAGREYQSVLGPVPLPAPTTLLLWTTATAMAAARAYWRRLRGRLSG